MTLSHLPVSQKMKILLFVLLGSCSTDYCDISESHQLCSPAARPADRCGHVITRGLTANVKDDILRQHNEQRSKLAAGQQLGLGGKLFPQAADMRQMYWDDELAQIAQVFSEKCIFDHDCHLCRISDRFSVGQNLAMGVRLAEVMKDDVSRATRWLVTLWLHEAAQANVSMPQAVISGADMVDIGHFTQIVWAETDRLGCGFIAFQNNEIPVDFMAQGILVCNYGPAGNVIGAQMYAIGTPCTRCQTSCSPEYNSLCI